jgi:hypothetical protein
MKSQKTLSKLTLKIQKIKQIIKELEQLENNDSAETISELLKMMVSLFEEVDQRLTELEIHH